MYFLSLSVLEDVLTVELEDTSNTRGARSKKITWLQLHSKAK